MRHKHVVVAIVQDASQRFLVTYNEKWFGYAFPMDDFDSQDAFPTGRLAIEAVEKDLGYRLPLATATELEFLGTFGQSGTSREGTWYEYWVFSVDPGQILDLTARPNSPNNPPQFLEPQELLRQTGLTWSTSRIIQEFIEHQDAVIAVITRPGQTETEYLVVNNANYGGYFFPVTRLKNELTPIQIAKKLVHLELGYRGDVNAEWCSEIEDIHFSSRYQQDRHYKFQVCRIDLPQIDLMQPYNPLELAMCQRGKQWGWVTANELTNPSQTPSHQLSPTIDAVVYSILGAVPPRPRTEPLRRSEGGIALIERTVDGEKQWLVRWNDNWTSFFIGGHREPNESFRDCVIREVCEELGLQPGDFTVADHATTHLEYVATSKSAGVPTAYTMELFNTKLAPDVELRIDNDHENNWLTENDVRSLTVAGVRPVSVTVQVLLAMHGAISCKKQS